MEVYTSYFGNLRKLHEAGIFPVSIALWPPKFFNGAVLKTVAPKKYMLDDSLTDQQYTDMFEKDVLSQVTPAFFLNQLHRLSGGRDVAILCYEKPGEFCHRHIVGKWLENYPGEEIEEFGLPKIVEPKEPAPEQQSLF